MPKPIHELSDDQLQALIANFERHGVVESKLYSLAEARLEVLRRKPSTIETRAAAAAIVELSARSPTGLISYKELWAATKGSKWSLVAKTQTTNCLDRLIAYCVSKNLPLINTLVVREGASELGADAVAKTVDQARSLGVHIGPDPVEFIHSQQAAARALVASSLPPEAEEPQ